MKQTRWLRFCCLGAAVAAVAGCAGGPPSIDPESPSGQLTLSGKQILERGDDAVAADYFRRAVEANDQNVEALQALATLEEKFGQNKDAAAHWRRAGEVDPDHGVWARSLGKNLLVAGQLDEARAAYERAIRIDDKDIKALNGLGIAKARALDCDGATASLKQAHELDSSDKVSLNNLAYVQLLCGHTDDAIALLEPAIEDANPMMRQNLALAYGLSGQDTDAARVAAMDLPQQKVKDNMAFYRKQRSKDGAPAPKPPRSFALLGPFPTMAMAHATAEGIAPEAAAKQWTPIARADLADPHGTPRFVVEVPLNPGGRWEDLKAMCEGWAQAGHACRMRP